MVRPSLRVQIGRQEDFSAAHVGQVNEPVVELVHVTVTCGGVCSERSEGGVIVGVRPIDATVGDFAEVSGVGILIIGPGNVGLKTCA